MVVMALAAGALTTACSDWDDHYDTFTSDATATIWQNIKADTALTDFASLVERAGYVDLLNGTQTITVWAPVNDAFNYDSVAAIDDETLVTEFIENHIARSNFPASAAINENVFLLNKKVIPFAGAGDYTMGGLTVLQPNMASKNGTLHAIKGLLPFRANIYESLNNRVYPIDSLADYYHKYEVSTLDVNNSVPGPTVNGQLTYLDSVLYESNGLFYRFGGNYLNTEDSSYTMIVPTNKAWEGYKAMVAPYYNYLPKVEFDDRSDNDRDTVYSYNSAYLRDSMITRAVIRSLVFNNNSYGDGGNRKLKTYTGGELDVDSIVPSASGVKKLFKDDANELFKGTKRVDKSNGAMWITADDSLHQRPWNSFAPVIKVEGESSNCLVSSEFSKQTHYVTSVTRNTEVPGKLSGSGYVSVAGDANPTVHFYLPNVLSTEYNIYAVFVSENIDDASTPSSLCLPNNVQASLYYNVDGTGAKARRPQSLGKVCGNYIVAEDSLTGKDVNVLVPGVDTVKLGTFKFPIAYEGLDGVYPSLSLQSRVTTAQAGKVFDRTIRIDCIILVPKELDDYIETHPDYKYDFGNSSSYVIIY